MRTGCYVIGLAPLLQEPDPATEPSAATALTSAFLLPITPALRTRLMAQRLSLGCRLG